MRSITVASGLIAANGQAFPSKNEVALVNTFASMCNDQGFSRASVVHSSVRAGFPGSEPGIGMPGTGMLDICRMVHELVGTNKKITATGIENGLHAHPYFLRLVREVAMLQHRDPNELAGMISQPINQNELPKLSQMAQTLAMSGSVKRPGFVDQPMDYIKRPGSELEYPTSTFRDADPAAAVDSTFNWNHAGASPGSNFPALKFPALNPNSVLSGAQSEMDPNLGAGMRRNFMGRMQIPSKDVAQAKNELKHAEEELEKAKEQEKKAE
jgi:hypothetical protein